MTLPKAERALLADAVQELRLANVTQTERWASLHSHIVNSVLASGLYLLDSSGVATDSYATPYGSLAVANHGSTDATVTSGPPQGQAPGLGKGVARVPAATFKVINLAGTEWTIYGAAAGLVTVEAFTKPQPPHAANIAGGLVAALQLAATADNALGSAVPESVLAMIDPSGTVDRVRSLTGADGAGAASFAVAAMQPSSLGILANTPAANTAAVLTFNAVAGQRHRLTFLAISYSGGAPAGGRLTVNDATIGNILDVDVLNQGPQTFDMPPGGLSGTTNTTMTITLAAAGVGVIGKVSAAKVTA